MKLECESSGGGAMGPNTLLRLGGKCVGHFYEDAAMGIDGDQVIEDIATRYNAHDALVAALEACRSAMPSESPLYGVTQDEYDDIKSQADAALAMARKGG